MNALSYVFLSNRSDISLNELIWGFQNGLVTLGDALSLGAKMPEYNASLNNAFASTDEARYALESKLLESRTSKLPVKNDAAKNKWLKLTLLDQYERRRECAEPLQEVARIYADFDYPESMVEFVHYMPSASDYDPSKHSTEDNIERLIGKWEAFLGDMLD